MTVPLSISIPVYNVEKFLPDLIDSLAANSTSDYEIIFVDDCSSDGSWEIVQGLAKKLKSAHVKYVRHEKNSGLSAARNSGLRAASGEYIYLLDSDDMLQEGAIDRIVSAIRQKPRDMYLLDFDFFNTSFEYRARYSDAEIVEIAQARGVPPEPYTKQQHLHTWEGSRRYTRLREPDHAAIFDDFMRYTIFYSWSFVYKRSLVENLTFVPGKYFEDVQFTMLASLAADSFGLVFDEPIHLYRKREGSIMAAMNPQKIKDLTEAIAPVFESPIWASEADGTVRNTVLAIELQYHIWAVNDCLGLDNPADELRASILAAIKTIRERIGARQDEVRALFSDCRSTRDAVHARILLQSPIDMIFTLVRLTNNVQRSTVWRIFGQSALSRWRRH